VRVIVIFLVGLVFGAACAGAGLYYNPMTGASTPAVGGEQWLSYGSPLAENLALTHNGDLALPRNPADVPELWEGTIKDTALLLVELRNSDGSLFGLGSRISALSETTDLLSQGVGLDSFWTVSAPGKGSFFVIERENIWPVLKEVVLPTLYFAERWQGTKGYALTSGPLASGHGLLLGATGEFRGQRGSALERYELRRYSAADGALDMSAELGILLPAPVAKEPVVEDAGTN
jgi:hypothetical protein